MVNWINLENSRQLKELIEQSKEVPCLIFKHSTRCSISGIAKYRLEDDWNFQANEIKAYYLDVIDSRAISNEVAERFQVQHESPQALIINNGECTYDSSHLDISVQELKECYQD